MFALRAACAPSALGLLMAAVASQAPAALVGGARRDAGTYDVVFEAIGSLRSTPFPSDVRTADAQAVVFSADGLHLAIVSRLGVVFARVDGTIHERRPGSWRVATGDAGAEFVVADAAGIRMHDPTAPARRGWKRVALDPLPVAMTWPDDGFAPVDPAADAVRRVDCTPWLPAIANLGRGVVAVPDARAADVGLVRLASRRVEMLVEPPRLPDGARMGIGDLVASADGERFAVSVWHSPG